MAVSDSMRLVEQEIDERLRQLPLWGCARDNVLKATLDYYRDAHEAVLMVGAAAYLSRQRAGCRRRCPGASTVSGRLFSSSKMDVFMVSRTIHPQGGPRRAGPSALARGGSPARRCRRWPVPGAPTVPSWPAGPRNGFRPHAFDKQAHYDSPRASASYKSA